MHMHGTWKKTSGDLKIKVDNCNSTHLIIFNFIFFGIINKDKD